MGYINVTAAMKDAKELLDEKEDMQTRLVAVRNALRTAVTAGDATDEQAAWIEEAFPLKERATAEERVKALQAQLKAAEERAAKNGAKAA
jgi:hypothetical protein